MSRLGITPAQFAVMECLEREPGLSGAEIARRERLTPPTSCVIVANLERKGLLTRRSHGKGGRAQYLELTALGRENVEAGARAVEGVRRRLTADLEPEFRQSLMNWLRRVDGNRCLTRRARFAQSRSGKSDMNVLILGSGAREHALASAVAGSPKLGQLFVAPGNPGCETVATFAPLALEDHDAIVGFCREHQIDFVIVGPEAPLVAGIVDDLAAAGVAAFGPTRAAARLEGSKGFTKDFCTEFGIPTAEYRRFYDLTAALDYIAARGAPIVVKADGLAAGKGVVVAETLEEAPATPSKRCMTNNANAECVIEERLEGEEVSFFALTRRRGRHSLWRRAGSQARRRRRYGPNTGGMGAYSPSPLITDALSRTIM